MSSWTEKEDLFIIENHGRMIYQEMADALGRTKASVRSRIAALRASGQEIKRKKKGTMPSKNICWDCWRSTSDTRGCPWVRFFKPVKGWEAEKTQVKAATVNHPERSFESYVVRKCPLFVSDRREK